MPAAAAPPWDGVLVRFGEIGIKSAPVRRQMLERLRQNLLGAMQAAGAEGDAQRVGSRLWMVGPDVPALVDAATHTFGVVSASPARRVPATLEAIGAVAAELALRSPWASFAIRARREGTHPFTSQDVNVQVGSAVYRAAQAAGRSPKVDLGSPDFALDIDVRQDRAYLFTEQHEGPGGIPVGTQGTVLALVSDPDSFLAAWLMMRRGCAVVPLHAGTMGSLPLEAMAAMARWGLPREAEVLPLCKGAIAKPVLLEAAAQVAREHRATALVTGEGLFAALCAAPLPVLRPVCGLDPQEKARWAARVGLPAFEAVQVLDAKGPETVASALSMRRQVTA
ncbi:MAG: tRNA uracil 4-sulfurtransferase [Thermoplasmata archaeon]|jgi:thiamine biosynthesis protein ThiI|nr:tRNA uracil 4-sulfurtransferase [Thermoplasmata archaeon]